MARDRWVGVGLVALALLVWGCSKDSGDSGNAGSVTGPTVTVNCLRVRTLDAEPTKVVKVGDTDVNVFCQRRTP